MTNFEVERMEAAFEYLENKLNDHYSYLLGCGDPERVKKAQSLIARRMIAYNEVKDALTAFSLFDESDAAIAEKAFKDPKNNDHVFLSACPAKSLQARSTVRWAQMPSRQSSSYATILRLNTATA